mgnify:CR=1 FL=1
MKKFLSLLLSLCLLLGALPMQVLALPGDIFPSEGAVKTSHWRTARFPCKTSTSI